MKKTNVIWLVFLCALVSIAATAYGFCVGFLEWNVTWFALSSSAFFIEGTAAGAALLLAKRLPVRRTILFSLLIGAISSGLVIGLSFLINTVILRSRGETVALIVVFVLIFAALLYAAMRLKKLTGVKWRWRPIVGIILCACVLLSGLLPMLPPFSEWVYKRSKHAEPNPVGFATYTKRTAEIVGSADIYVSTDGDDSGAGTFDDPLATIQEARLRVRTMDKTGKDGIVVALKGGEYSVDGLVFTEEDGGTASCPITYCAYGDGEVVLNGGKTLKSDDFTSVTDTAVKSRLSADAAKKVVCADLKELGLTAADWGKLYPVGGYGTADQYDGDTTGPTPCSLYYNGEPCVTARYPNSGFLTVEGIVREGNGLESSTSNHAQRADWNVLRNPDTTIFTIDKNTADRIRSYASLDTVWLWTALMYNWADTTVPLKKFDYENRTLEPAYVSKFGAQKGTTYYIFNVIEELDAPGEWYLDRENSLLYLYPLGGINTANIMLSLSVNDLITVDGASFLRFKGLSLRGTRGNGMVINANDVSVEDCLISDLSGIGIEADGYRIRITDCELAHIGATGADIKGGDRETLTPGDNRVENCLFHDYSEVALTAGPGVNIFGVGNVCAHNEFYNSPQQAIFYGGNNILIEYNLIHDVALLSDDCSAIYAGRRWDYGGCVLRYNVMYNLGDDEHSPNGIYWDDGLSGQTAYGNMIVNCKANGFLIGGGRDHLVYNNVLINCLHAFSYDDRSRDGATNPDSWFKHSMEGEDMTQNLMASPWKTEVWQKAYSYMKDWFLDYSKTDDPNFIPNPSNSCVCGNLIVQFDGRAGEFNKSVRRYSDISGNAAYRLGAIKKLFVDPGSGDYRLRDDSLVYKEIPDFQSLPFASIGRRNK